MKEPRKVIHYELTVRVETPHQLDPMVKWLAKEGYDFTLTHPLGQYTEDAELKVWGCWADNLERVAKRLRRYDLDV